mmetsp:Transcript_14986/g.60170  ORF Transcript_14986/g.60170 Transcript_14986/m.60170 type:complete len:207 (-) Transcript_14986:798-1418(-)
MDPAGGGCPRLRRRRVIFMLRRRDRRAHAPAHQDDHRLRGGRRHPLDLPRLAQPLRRRPRLPRGRLADLLQLGARPHLHARDAPSRSRRASPPRRARSPRPARRSPRPAARRRAARAIPRRRPVLRQGQAQARARRAGKWDPPWWTREATAGILVVFCRWYQEEAVKLTAGGASSSRDGSLKEVHTTKTQQSSNRTCQVPGGLSEE